MQLDLKNDSSKAERGLECCSRSNDSLITTVEKLQGIRAAEKKTKETRAKTPKVDKQSVSKGQGRSVRQPSTSSDSSSEMEVEVLDCTEVQ